MAFAEWWTDVRCDDRKFPDRPDAELGAHVDRAAVLGPIPRVGRSQTGWFIHVDWFRASYKVFADRREVSFQVTETPGAKCLAHRTTRRPTGTPARCRVPSTRVCAQARWQTECRGSRASCTSLSGDRCSSAIVSRKRSGYAHASARTLVAVRSRRKLSAANNRVFAEHGCSPDRYQLGKDDAVASRALPLEAGVAKFAA
jgi:hypothetical protein